VGWAELNGTVYRGHALASALASRIEGFAERDIQQEVLRLAESLKGSFAFVAELGATAVICSDTIRSFPLFYILEEGVLSVSDDIDVLGAATSVGVMEDAEVMETYLCSGFVLGDRTLYRDVRCTQSAELLRVTSQQVASYRYWKHRCHRSTTAEGGDHTTEQLDVALTTAFERMLKSASDVGKWVVPLSGGHDSRLVVSYLRKLGVENVLCFSYGIPGNEQSRISAEVARRAGYPWTFVGYDEDGWKELHDSGTFKSYLRYAFNGNSTPHLQDFLAVQTLVRDGLVDSRDYFVPGHALDFIAGSHLKEAGLTQEDPEFLVREIIRRHFVYGGSRPYAQADSLRALLHGEDIAPYEWPEYFNWQERQTKFIANSVRTYEFWGCHWRLPFWDQDLVDLCVSIPAQQRLNRAFLLSREDQLLISDLRGVEFAKGAGPSTKQPDRKRRLQGAVPAFFLSALVRVGGRRTSVSEWLLSMFPEAAFGSVYELLKPLSKYPRGVRGRLVDIAPRKTFQWNYHALVVAYTLQCLIDGEPRKMIGTLNTPLLQSKSVINHSDL
jgi:asparagine synthase (glutamine-hydrolysing)